MWRSTLSRQAKRATVFLYKKARRTIRLARVHLSFLWRELIHSQQLPVASVTAVLVSLAIISPQLRIIAITHTYAVRDVSIQQLDGVWPEFSAPRVPWLPDDQPQTDTPCRVTDSAPKLVASHDDEMSITVYIITEGDERVRQLHYCTPTSPLIEPRSRHFS